MNQPTPAIVAQSAVRRLPRLALLLFCAAYVLPGLLGRQPWKNADITALGYMVELARGQAHWLAPTLLGQPPEFDGLLPYWLGAWALRAAPGWIAPEFAARLPFGLMLVLTLAATWYSVHALARRGDAQPVAFAFGGEANPVDYARALADAGLLALIATLGLAQFSHEATPAVVQLGFTTLLFNGLASLRPGHHGPVVRMALGAVGLALSGAPTLALLLCLGGAVIRQLQPDVREQAAQRGTQAAVLLTVLGVIVLSSALNLWRWRLGTGHDVVSGSRLLAWFTWPAGPLALWTVWRWRRQWLRLHIALPLWFAGIAIATAFGSGNGDRSLLLSLPALATLAALALPTLRRSVSALIDWFTLLFFTGCAIVIWVIWVAMQTGVPAQPAANVARVVPGFVPTFSWWHLLPALMATLAWAWLVKWRAGRHRHALWKSMVLPAGGAALCWLLLMTLWLPLLDYARGYGPVMREVRKLVSGPGCVAVHGLNAAQTAALRVHTAYDLRPLPQGQGCPWLISHARSGASLAAATDLSGWQRVGNARRPRDADDNLLIHRRVSPQ